MYASARKSPHFRLLLLLVLGPWADSAGAQVQDSSEAFRKARAAEAEYERAARRLAPLGSSERSGTCDEYVGRFCIYYDSGRDSLPTEPPEIKRVRERAIQQLRDAFEINPARAATALPYIRLLIEDKRTAEAVAVALRFGESSPDSLVAAMLRTLAYHANGEIESSERAIEVWLAGADSAERRRLEDLRWLLDSRERKRYRLLDPNLRQAYERRFWRYADALYLTPGNETRTEHFARHAENRLIRVTPSVLGSTGWGTDVAELTIRFGTPKARTRLWSTGMGSEELSLIEHWDPEQMIYAPPQLDSVLRIHARPAGGWPMDTIRTVSGHSPPTFRRMLPLEHQANVFPTPAGGWVFRVDGLVRPDSVTSGRITYREGLFLLARTLSPLAALTRPSSFEGDSILLRLEMPLPDSASFYSAEVLESSSRLAARARFPIERPEMAEGLALSSIVIAAPFLADDLPTSRDQVSPLPTLLLPAGLPFGVYAEVRLPDAEPRVLKVELELLAIDGSPGLVRAARWLGKQLGVTGEAPTRKMAWSVDSPAGGTAPVAVTIDAGNLKTGRYIIEMSVASGSRRAVARREIFFSASETSSRRP